MNHEEILFRERYAAALSLKNWWTRLASTYGCILVVLTKRMLVVKPHWFLRWLTAPLRLDLHHEIPITRIQDVATGGGGWGYGKVEVRFRTAGGESRTILLFLRRHREFVRALKEVLPR